MESMAKKRTGSRHKPRKMLAIPPRLYEQLAELASRNERPINWQAWIILHNALAEEGFPPLPALRDLDKESPKHPDA